MVVKVFNLNNSGGSIINFQYDLAVSFIKIWQYTYKSAMNNLWLTEEETSVTLPFDKGYLQMTMNSLFKLKY